MKLRPSFLLNIATASGDGGGGAAPIAPAQPSGQGLDVGALLGFGQSTGPVQMAAPSGGGVGDGGTGGGDGAKPDTSAKGPSSVEEMIMAQAAASKPAAKDPDPKHADSAAPVEQPTGFDFAKWFADKYPENPDPTKIAKAEDWKSARSLAAKAFDDVKSLSSQKLELEQRLAAFEKASKTDGKAPTLPESEAVKQLQLQIEQLKQETSGKLSEYEKLKAGQDLAANPAFRAEFDGKRAALVDELKGIAEEADVDQSIVDAALSAKTHFQLAKALEGIEDATAKRLIEQRAAQFVELSNKREAALKGNPMEELAKWKDYEQTMQGALAAQLTGNLKAQVLAAVPTVAEELAGENGDIYFRTPAGQAALAEISSRFENGFDLPPAEVVKSMAQAKMGEFYAGMTQSLFKQLNEVTALLAAKDKELSRYADLEPRGGGAPLGAGGGGSGGFDIGGMFGAIRGR